jgi:hypothetical protein
MPNTLVDLESRRVLSNCRSPSWVICDPAPLPEQVVVVEVQTVIAIGPVIPATVPTID